MADSIDEKVSIIMPTFNRAFSIWKSILSVQQQTYTNWELLIVDDNSTDDTRKLMREFVIDTRIKYLTNKGSKGAAGARQFGLEHATGEYISYLDSDNTVLTNWLSIMVNKLRSDSRAVIAYPNMNFSIMILENEIPRLLKEESSYKADPNSSNLWNHTFEGDPNGMVLKKTAQSKARWDTGLSLFEDYDYSLQLARNFPEGIVHVPLVLVNYTRLYGEAGVCNDAGYDVIISNLEYLKNKYTGVEEWEEQTWYDELIEKYTNLSVAGETPIGRILKKYGVR